MAGQRVAALVRHSFADIVQWQMSLRSLANQLEDLERRAKRAVAVEVGVPGSELRLGAWAEDESELAWDVDHLAGAESDSSAPAPGEVEGDQPAPPPPRKRRPPSTAKKSTRRKS